MRVEILTAWNNPIKQMVSRGTGQFTTIDLLLHFVLRGFVDNAARTQTTKCTQACSNMFTFFGFRDLNADGLIGAADWTVAGQNLAGWMQAKQVYYNRQITFKVYQI